MSQINPFKMLSEICDTLKIDVIVIGAYAVGAHGYQRATADVDFMVDEESADAIGEKLLDYGYEEAVRTEIAVRYMPTNKDDDNIYIDIILVNPATFKEVLTDAKKESYEGSTFYVPSLNHIIALKLHAIKQQPNKRKYKDLNDILELISFNKMDVRSKEFKDLCLKFGTEELYKEISEHSA